MSTTNQQPYKLKLCCAISESFGYQKQKDRSRPAMKKKLIQSFSGGINTSSSNPPITSSNFGINNTTSFQQQQSTQQLSQFGNPPQLPNQVQLPHIYSGTNVQNPIHTGSAAVPVTLPNNCGINGDYSSDVVGTQQITATKPSSGTRKKQTTAQKRPEEEVLPKEGGPLTKDDIRHNDVLSGRGGKINAHPGNMQFRTIVLQYRPRYLDAATRKLQKGFIAKDVVDYVRKELKPPGRFLEEEEGVWYEIGDKRAIKKAGQALREDKDDNGVGNCGDDNSSTPGDINLTPHSGQPPLPPSTVISGNNANVYPTGLTTSLGIQNAEGIVMNSTTSGIIGRAGTSSPNNVMPSTALPPGVFASGTVGAAPPPVLMQPRLQHQHQQQQTMQLVSSAPTVSGTGAPLQVGFSPKMAPYTTGSIPRLTNSNSGSMPPPANPIMDVPITGRVGGQHGIPGSSTFMSPPLSINYNSSASNNNNSVSQQRPKGSGGIVNFIRGSSASVSGAARDAMMTQMPDPEILFGRPFHAPTERDTSVMSGISDLTTPMSTISGFGSENAAMLTSQQQTPNLQSWNQKGQSKMGLHSTTSTSQMVASSTSTAQMISSSDAGIGDSLRLSNIQREIARAPQTGTGVASVVPVGSTVPASHNQTNTLRFSSITMNDFDSSQMRCANDNRNSISMEGFADNRTFPSYMQMQQQGQQLTVSGVGNTLAASNNHQFNNVNAAYVHQQQHPCRFNTNGTNSLFKYSSNASVGSESAGSHSFMKDDMSIFSKSSRGAVSHSNMVGGSGATYRSSSPNGKSGQNPYHIYNNNGNDDQSIAELSNVDDLTYFTFKSNVSDSMLSQVSNTIKALDLASVNNEGSSGLLFAVAHHNPQQQQYQQSYHQHQQQANNSYEANPFFDPSEPITKKAVEYDGKQMFEL